MTLNSARLLVHSESGNLFPLLSSLHCPHYPRYIIDPSTPVVDSQCLASRPPRSMGKGRFSTFDAFSKTVEDAKIRTASGGVVTITSLVMIFFLITLELIDYRRVVMRPELIVDKSRGEKLTIHFNVTFPKMPCELLTLDVMDVSGELQAAIDDSHTIVKSRLTQDLRQIDSRQLSLHSEEEASHLAPDYCGPCYGAPPPDSGCCNACQEVKDAYAKVGWAFGDGTTMEQCQREHYKEKLDEQAHEACNMAGSFSVNKVVGNFHFAPGRSFSANQMHVHDLNEYMTSSYKHSFKHIIHSLSFGSNPGSLSNPLDGHAAATDETSLNYMYFLKVVSTRFEYMNGNLFDTNQYSVTSHERNIMGGTDNEHHVVHARGGIPGVFFSYDISPMRVINREQRVKSFGGLVAGICSVIGGVISIAAMVDRGVYVMSEASKAKKMI